MIPHPLQAPKPSQIDLFDSTPDTSLDEKMIDQHEEITDPRSRSPTLDERSYENSRERARAITALSKALVLKNFQLQSQPPGINPKT